MECCKCGATWGMLLDEVIDGECVEICVDCYDKLNTEDEDDE